MWGSCSYHLWHFLSWGPCSRIGETIHLFFFYHRCRREYLLRRGFSVTMLLRWGWQKSAAVRHILHVLCCRVSGNYCDRVESATPLVWKVSWWSSKYVTKWNSYSKVVCNLQWVLNALSYATKWVDWWNKFLGLESTCEYLVFLPCWIVR